MRTKWFRDETDGNSYRVNYFTHRNGRIMEQWVSMSGEKWYMEPGVTQETVLLGHKLKQCDPIPGLLCPDLDLDWNS
jgi:hypothetical protein